MRQFPYEEEPREPGLIERGVAWVLTSKGFNALVVLVSAGVVVWSSWKALVQMAMSF